MTGSDHCSPEDIARIQHVGDAGDAAAFQSALKDDVPVRILEAV